MSDFLLSRKVEEKRRRDFDKISQNHQNSRLIHYDTKLDTVFRQ